jgi:hypothetical protein
MQSLSALSHSVHATMTDGQSSGIRLQAFPAIWLDVFARGLVLAEGALATKIFRNSAPSNTSCTLSAFTSISTWCNQGIRKASLCAPSRDASDVPIWQRISYSERSRAFRNLRELEKMHRDELIDQANQHATHASSLIKA